MAKCMVSKWQRLSSKIIADFSFFQVFEHRCKSLDSGKEAPFLSIDAGVWATIIATTDDGCFVMVEQCRHGVNEVTLEFPSGYAENSDKDIFETAKREVLEETGYSFKKIESLGYLYPNPGIFDTKSYIFLASGCRRIGPQKLDSREEIGVKKVPIKNFPKLIRNRSILNAQTISSYYLFRLRENLN